MNCLCCGKPLRTENTDSGWHKSCIKRFFGTAELPEIAIDETAFEALATESTNKGYTVPGVQKKLSLHLFSEGNTPRLTLVNYPTGYILKPQVPEFEALPQAEQLVMCMADAAGISTVPHALIMEKDSLAYITKRVDRIFTKNSMQMLAMEDFCQLDLRLTGLDITELYLRLVFSFLVGNSDMHLKNFSLIETEEGSGKYVLSPAYDLLPVNVIMPEDKEQFALAMNGKKTHIRRKDFLVFAEKCGMTRGSAEKMIAMLVSKKEKLLAMCQNSLLPESLQERLASLIEERASVLEG